MYDKTKWMPYVVSFMVRETTEGIRFFHVLCMVVTMLINRVIGQNQLVLIVMSLVIY